MFNYQIKYNSEINAKEIILIPSEKLLNRQSSINYFIVTNGLKYHINIRLYETTIQLYFDKECNISLKNCVLNYIINTFKKETKLLHRKTEIYDIYTFNITDPETLIKLI